jgi:lambda repressor-like predicted transcriptional regulator
MAFVIQWPMPALHRLILFTMSDLPPASVAFFIKHGKSLTYMSFDSMLGSSSLHPPILKHCPRLQHLSLSRLGIQSATYPNPSLKIISIPAGGWVSSGLGNAPLVSRISFYDRRVHAQASRAGELGNDPLRSPHWMVRVQLQEEMGTRVGSETPSSY